MASTDARPVPLKNTAFRVTFPVVKNDGTLVAGAAGLDSEVSKDAGTFADCTNEATEIATSSGVYYLDLTSTEMNADTVAIKVTSTTTGALPVVITLYPQEADDIKVSLTYVGSSAAGLNDFADALLNRDMSAVSDTEARSPLNALRFLRNKWSISGTTLTVCEEDDSTTAWTATITATAGADPITATDPA